MPSWNIHIHQTERLLARGRAVSRVVADANVFLFANLMPDVPVGYMVPGVAHVPYRETHLTDPVPIPTPHERAYWDAFVVPALAAARAAGEEVSPRGPRRLLCDADARPAIIGAAATSVPVPPPCAPVAAVSPVRADLDLALGVWSHLLADAIWNHRVGEHLDMIGGEPGEGFRIKKQADFDGFGRTLALSSVPRETATLLGAVSRYPQYRLERQGVHDSIVVAHEIVRSSGAIDHPPYRLLTEAFFASVLEEVVVQTDLLLADRLG